MRVGQESQKKRQDQGIHSPYVTADVLFKGSRLVDAGAREDKVGIRQNSFSMDEFKYRADIDGLRAIAVMLVMFFHAGLIVPCGFIGVDVFFVISGFLITGLILKEQRQGRFLLSRFWLRRIRRIVPAASLVVMTTLVAAFFLLLPDDYEELAKSTVAQQLMWSNIFFWKNTGYFSGDAELKPLLHTWSLSVEEQFYLVYPFLLVFLNRFRKRTMFVTIAGLAVLSFGASQYGLRNHSSATFYLLPTRAWELLLGALLCFAPGNLQLHKWQNGLLSLLGLSATVLPAFCFDRNVGFPGAITLVSCLGTAIFIQGNSHQRTLAGRLVAAKPVAFVGLISYSLYLWHWPILTLTRHLWMELYLAEPSQMTRILALSLSIILAILSWWFIETPIRGEKLLSGSVILLISAFGTTLLLVIVAANIVRQNGLPTRFDPQVIRYVSARHGMEAYDRNVSAEDVDLDNLPSLGVPGAKLSCLLWGDSHAMALGPGLQAACRRRKVEIFQATRYATVPLLGFEHERVWNNSEASDFCQSAFDFAVSKKVNAVILAAAWSRYAPWPSFEPSLRRTVDELTSAGIIVAIVLDVAEQEADVPLMLSAAVRLHQDVSRIGVSVQDYQRKNELNIEIIKKHTNNSVAILDPSPLFVDNKGLWRAELGGESLYADDDHLSVEGSLRLQPLFEQVLARIHRLNDSSSQLPFEE